MAPRNVGSIPRSPVWISCCTCSVSDNAVKAGFFDRRRSSEGSLLLFLRFSPYRGQVFTGLTNRVFPCPRPPKCRKDGIVMAYIEKMVCDCGGELVFAGKTIKGHTVMYVHQCNKCSEIELFDAAYPHEVTNDGHKDDSAASD